MDKSALSHLMTDAEHDHFETEGYLYVEDALSTAEVEALTAEVEGLQATAIAEGTTTKADNFSQADIVGKNDHFLNVVDNPRVLPKVWGAMGWNIMLYHSHLHIKPPAPDAGEGEGWMEFHQDSSRVNLEMKIFPQARISLKVGYFLTDVSEPGRGNFYVIPGSHMSGEVPISSEVGRDPAESVSEGIPEGAIPVCAKPGTAVLFDRRLWHGRSANHSELTRKAVFYGYSYRWIQPKDLMTVDHVLDRCDPVRRQLLGEVVGNNGRYSPKDDDVPLRGWLIEQLGEEAVNEMDATHLAV